MTAKVTLKPMHSETDPSREYWHVMDGDKSVGQASTSEKKFGKDHVEGDNYKVPRRFHGGVGSSSTWPKYRGEGYNTQARVLRDEQSKHKKMYSAVSENNPASKRVAEKAGYKKVRTVRAGPIDDEPENFTWYVHKTYDEPMTTGPFGVEVISKSNKYAKANQVRNQLKLVGEAKGAPIPKQKLKGIQISNTERDLNKAGKQARKMGPPVEAYTMRGTGLGSNWKQTVTTYNPKRSN